MYKLLGDLTPKFSKEPGRVGLYIDETGEEVVIKKHRFNKKDKDLSFILREGKVLKGLNRYAKFSNLFPKFIDITEGKNEVKLVTSHIEGKRADKVNKKLRLAALKQVLEKLNHLSKVIGSGSSAFPVTKPSLYYISFAINLLMLLSKEGKSGVSYLKFGARFYLNSILGSKDGIRSGLVHRDLYPDNILISAENKVALLDWESAVVSDSLYDLAQVAMIYTRGFGPEEIIKIINEYLANNSERRRFISLAIFNAIQILSFHNPEDREFKEVNEFLEILVSKIAPNLIVKKAPFEVINLLTLDLISLFYKLTGISKISKNKKIILCYHSIGNNGWRFATRTENFIEQVGFLRKNYKLLSLSDLLKKNTLGVDISFDDGYVDVYKNALPNMKGLSATMLALGDCQKANREELDNTLKIMDYKMLKSLHKKGWEIGSHTMSHANLGQISDQKLGVEITESKNLLEKNLGIKIKYLAYPKGIYTKKITDFAKKAGYKAAFTVDGKEVKLGEFMRLDRVPTEGELTISQFEALLSPLGLKITGFYMQILQIKERLSQALRKFVDQGWRVRIRYS